MDSDLKYIIDEEQKLGRMLDDARRSARERIESYRMTAAEKKKKEFERITSEYSSMTGHDLQAIKNEMDKEHERLRREQEGLLEDKVLMNKITGRIVTVILENR